MKRVKLKNGKWFGASKAKCYEEDTRHDGQNFISCATGTQWGT